MRKARILCVDDTQANLEVLIELLGDYDLVVSLDAQNGWELMQQMPVDMILLDIMMPGMDGFALAKMIKEDERFSSIPLLFLSAKSDEASMERGYELGAVDYVTKPFRPKELLARVKTHLQLHSLVQGLEAEVERGLAKQRTQEHLLLQQSYTASMGEMIDIVAHQWMQPLNVVNMRLSKLLLDVDDGFVDRAYLATLQERSLAQIRHLVETLNAFRSFMSPHRSIKRFGVRGMLEKTVQLVGEELHRSKIALEITGEDFEIVGVENELIQVVLTLLQNAKEAFTLQKAPYPKVSIVIDAKGRRIVLEDNAGGIAPQMLRELFTLHATSKRERGGSGVGLYIAQMIVQKHKGEISVQNVEEGARFTVLLPAK